MSGRPTDRDDLRDDVHGDRGVALQQRLDHLLGFAADGVAWSACVRTADGRVLAASRPDVVRSTASVGKLLLLVECARRVAQGRLDPVRTVRREPVDAVADSGLWQHLGVDALPVGDLALLVGSVSDNLATNVLLRHLGLDDGLDGRALDLPALCLLDRVRDVRTAAHPPRLSEGTAAQWSELVRRVAVDDLPWPGAAGRVRGWCEHAVDTSMVASALHVDPLAHGSQAGPVSWWGKTGTDADVRADVGWLSGRVGALAYAVLAQGAHLDGPHRDRVMGTMRAVGRLLRATVDGGPTSSGPVGPLRG